MKKQSILSCILFIGILCINGGAVAKPFRFRSFLAENSRGAEPTSANTTNVENDPESVVQMVERSINESITRRELGYLSCGTGNPIDDCWRCDSDWEQNRQRLADCGIGFGRNAIGGKNGSIYLVTDPNDYDAVNPRPGTLRHAVIQTEPLWIIFQSDMVIQLKEELIMNSYKTIDGRGVNVHIAKGPCITIQNVSHIIIHGIHVHDCKPAGNAMVRDSPTHYGWRTMCDGDAISIFGRKMIFRVKYTDERCKIDAINALNAIQGVSAENDNNKGKLLRDVTVTVTGKADREIPGRILKVFGSLHKKFVFKVTFKDLTHQNNALKTVKALRGTGLRLIIMTWSVVTAEFERVNKNRTVYGPNMPSILNVTGDADPKIVLNNLQKFGTAQIH